jgi:hypothetical protein
MCFPVSVTGRNEEHYYELSRFKVAQPRDWTALEAAFAEKLAVVGYGHRKSSRAASTVDIGVRAFMPASRSGTKDAAELEKLVGQRRSLPHHQARRHRRKRGCGPPRGAGRAGARAAAGNRSDAAMKEGDTVSGTGPQPDALRRVRRSGRHRRPAPRERHRTAG